MSKKVKGYKGFDGNFCCRGMQYAEGKTFSVSTANGPLEVCEHGLHFCTKLSDVFYYYPPFDPYTGTRSIYAEVTATGDVVVDEGDACTDTKCVTDKLQVGERIDLVRDLPCSKDLYYLGDNALTQESVALEGREDTAVGTALGQVIRSTKHSIALRGWSVVSSEDVAIAVAPACLVVGSAVAIALDPLSVAESETLSIAMHGLSSVSEHTNLIHRKHGEGIMGVPGRTVGGIALGEFAEAKSPRSVAIGSCLRGVKGSLLVFLRVGISPGPASDEIDEALSEPSAYAVRVDGDKVKENVWYKCDLQGKLQETGYGERKEVSSQH